MKRTVVLIVLAMLCWMPMRGCNANAAFANDIVLKESEAAETEKLQAQVAELEEKLRVANEEAKKLRLKVSELGMEVVRLKAMLQQAKVDTSKNTHSLVRIQQMEEVTAPSELVGGLESIVATEATFGIYLGESFADLARRRSYRSANSTSGGLENGFLIFPVPNGVKALGVKVYAGRVSDVICYFSNGSEDNRDVTEQLLTERFGEPAFKEDGPFTITRGFNGTLGDVPVLVMLQFERNIFEDDDLVLCYSHVAINGDIEEAKTSKTKEEVSGILGQ